MFSMAPLFMSCLNLNLSAISHPYIESHVYNILFKVPSVNCLPSGAQI